MIFPPAAPAGPVLVLRRGEPGQRDARAPGRGGRCSTGHRRTAAISARAAAQHPGHRPAGFGQDGAAGGDRPRPRRRRARGHAWRAHRQFRWPTASKVELVAPAPASTASSYGALAAGARLQPDLLVVDASPRGDIRRTRRAPAARRARHAGRARIRRDGRAPGAGSVDLVVRLGPSADGLFRVVSVEDASGAPVFVHDGRQAIALARRAGLRRQSCRSAGMARRCPRVLVRLRANGRLLRPAATYRPQSKTRYHALPYLVLTAWNKWRILRIGTLGEAGAQGTIAWSESAFGVFWEF